MRQLVRGTLLAVICTIGGIALLPEAEAIPAFSRQTGQSCQACHHTSLPRLNREGRQFMLNGFRDRGTPEALDHERLALPANLTADMILETIVSSGITRSDPAGSTGKVPIDSGGILHLSANGLSSKNVALKLNRANVHVAGRIGGRLGAVSEISLIGGNIGLTSAKINYTFNEEGNTFGLIGGTTDTYGAAYIFNDPSTTLRTDLQSWQHSSAALRTNILSLNAVNEGVQASAMTGLGAYAHLASQLYMAIGAIIPTSISTAGQAIDFDPSFYARAAYTGDFGSTNLIFGSWYSWQKHSNYNLAAGAGGSFNATEVTMQYGLDAQIETMAGPVALGLYAPLTILAEQPTRAIANADADWRGIYPMLTLDYRWLGVYVGWDFAELQDETIASPTTVESQTIVAGLRLSLAQNAQFDLEFKQQDVDNLDLQAAGPGVVGPVHGANSEHFSISVVGTFAY